LPAHFKGQENFKGLRLHSALWTEDIDVDGKHVAVIGNRRHRDCSLCPRSPIAVASVTVYQRTAQWARPVKGYSEAITEGAQWLLAHFALLCAVVSLQHVLALWRWTIAVPAQGSELGLSRSRRQQSNDRHRQELTDFIVLELKDRPDLIRKMRADLSALWQAHPARQRLVSDVDEAEC